MFSNKAAPKHQDSVTEVKLEQKEVVKPEVRFHQLLFVPLAQR